MRKEQKAIYVEGNTENHFDSPPENKKFNRRAITTKILSFFKAIFSLHKFIVPLTILFVLIWNFGGQFFLPKEYRFPTYMGERIGDIESQSIVTSLPQEAEKAGIISSEQAQVEVEKNCVNQRNQQAQQALYECLANGGTLFLCDFRRSEILRQVCAPFTPRQLEQPRSVQKNQGE